MIFSPHPYQQFCIDKIISDEAVGLFLRPGLGKTAITLSAVNVLKYQRWQISKVLVVAPKTVAEGTWSAESSKWDQLSHLRVISCTGCLQKRIRSLSTIADVYVINRENVPWLVDYYKQSWPFDMVVLDESTSFKNARSKRFHSIKLIRRFVKKIVLLTGTPTSRSIEDLWAQVFLLDGGQRLGRTLTAFRELHMTPDRRSRDRIFSYKAKSEDALDSVLSAISDICVSMKAEDYLSLPEKVEHIIPVSFPPKESAAYADFERTMLLEIADAEAIEAVTAAVLTGKLLQFCGGAVYDENGSPQIVSGAKMDAYLELLERLGGEPCLTFYGYKSEKDRIMAALSKSPLRVREYKTPQDGLDWNAGEIDVLLAHPASCAYGLNLQAGGRHVVWYSPNWSFELNDQGVCRLWRQGSTAESVIVHYLICQNTVDEEVMAAIRRRTGTHESLMQILKARIASVHKKFTSSSYATT